MTSESGNQPPGDDHVAREAETNSRKKSSNPRSSTSGLPPKPKKKYTKRAPVWQHFLVQEDNETRACCRYCGTEVGCDSKSSGTSPMNNHIGRCKMFKEFDERDKQTKLAGDNSGNMSVVKYDPHLFRRSTNKMIVLNELPFSFVESEGFRSFVANMLPMYQPFSRRTSSRDIVEMYEFEKKKLKELFRDSKQRVSLTTDIWVSPTTSYNYMVVTGHWIDSNWVMQKRILYFKVITDHRGETICGHLIECIEEWGIDRIFTVTVDNAKANDKGLGLFRDFLRSLGGDTMIVNGEFMHMRCCAHILNLIVGDGLKKTKPSIVAIRNAIKYVRSHYNRLISFVMRCETGKVQRGSLPLDVVTRWNSTFLMLKKALKYRVPFDKMLSEDKLYCDYFKEVDEKSNVKRVGPPANSDWDDVALLVKFLKIFYKCTLTFSASKSVTSSLCYKELVDLERSLIVKSGSKDEKTKEQAHIMRDKFDKYWDGMINMNPLVIIASVFDPRNKMQFAVCCFDELYGKDTVESRKIHRIITTTMKKLYEDYSSRLAKPNESPDFDGGQESAAVPDMFMDLSDDEDVEKIEDIYNRASSSNNESAISELDVYLNEKAERKVENKLDMPYDVLSWWKCNSSKFPILSELARDVLAIQVSSVASESVFSTSGRLLDPYRSSLTPHMVEVLLCTQQWLRCSPKGEEKFNNIIKMMEELEFFDSLDPKAATTEPLLDFED